MNNLVIFSPNRFSLYTTTVTELFLRAGQSISAIYVRSLLNPARALSEFRRDGSRLLNKVWKKLILRQSAYNPTSPDNLSAFRRNQRLTITDLNQFKSQFNIPIHYCPDLNRPEVLEGLRSTQPSLVIFTGGGLIRQPILDHAGAGVVNCHMGILPHFRGMDVVEWPLLLGQPQHVGLTVHFMDKGVDTGPILAVRPIPPLPGETIPHLRNRMEAQMSQFMVETCLAFLSGSLRPLSQSLSSGRQYFRMHPRLLPLARENLIGMKGQDPND